jgi:hypothetical protein
MAGLKGKSRSPANMNAFKHGLAFITGLRLFRSAARKASIQHEENVRQQILEGLIPDKCGDDQIRTATRILAEVIARDASWLRQPTACNRLH